MNDKRRAFSPHSNSICLSAHTIVGRGERGLEDISIAYTINIEKTNLENGTDIQSAAITMIVGKDWVEANGGIEAVK